MSVPHVIKATDLLDQLVNVPPSRAEAAQILAFFLPLVADSSPAIEASAYGQARRELSAAVHFDLHPTYFEEGVEIGAELTVRASGFAGSGPYSHLSDDYLAEAFCLVVDYAVEGVAE